MASYEAWHWRTVNVMMRAFGVMALVAASAFFGWAVLLLAGFQPPLTGLNRTAPALAPVWPPLIAGAISLGIGLLALRRKPFRPDLGDASWIAEPQVAKAQAKMRLNRNWWTGDPQPPGE